MTKRTIPYYRDFLSDSTLEHLLKEAKSVSGIEELKQVGSSGGLENKESFQFLADLYVAVESELNSVLNRRIKDRKFIDERTKAIVAFNQEWNRDFLSPDYKTVLGLEDAEGRIVIGPKTLNPADRRASAAPLTSGTSEPITTRSINNSFAKATIAALFVMSSG